MSTFHILPDWNGQTTPLRHTWEGIVNIDQFRWMVRRDVQEQLKGAHDEIGARHVRAVGMFDDEMRVLGKDPRNFRLPGCGENRLNWQIVDYVIDSLLDMGISPMFTTSFVPSEYASGDATVFTTKGHVSLPRDWAEWRNLVTQAVRHSIERYGIEIVRGWYFEVWNEPNLGAFFGGDQNDFFSLWKHTHAAIKEVDSTLRVGGPSTARGEWVPEFVHWTQDNDCAADYVITHVYNNDSESGALSPFDGPQEHQASRSPHFASGVVRGVKRVLDELNFKGEIHWNEWGRSWWPHFPDRESPNEAAFMVKTMAEVSQQADYFAYWCLSDVYDQLGYGSSAFQGHYGMVNLQGLRKPHYHAHQLMTMLGTQRVNANYSGDETSGAIVTQSESELAVLVYGYQSDDQYSPQTREIAVELPSDAKWQNGKVQLWRLGAHDNNIVSKWQEFGAPEYLSREQTRELQAQNGLQTAPADAVKIENRIARFNSEVPGVELLKIEL